MSLQSHDVSVVCSFDVYELLLLIFAFCSTFSSEFILALISFVMYLAPASNGEFETMLDHSVLDNHL